MSTIRYVFEALRESLAGIEGLITLDGARSRSSPVTPRRHGPGPNVGGTRGVPRPCGDRVPDKRPLLVGLARHSPHVHLWLDELWRDRGRRFRAAKARRLPLIAHSTLALPDSRAEKAHDCGLVLRGDTRHSNRLRVRLKLAEPLLSVAHPDRLKHLVVVDLVCWNGRCGLEGGRAR